MARPLRYTFILILVALGTCLAAVVGWRYARASAPVSGPIVLVSIDALRADRLGAYGHQPATTPAIDSLAADGVVFERAYSHVPQTLPAHTALLSGRLPFETGVRNTVGITVPASERLLQEMLGDRGFATGGVVSTFLLRRETGIGQGFAFFDDAMSAAGALLPGLRRGGNDAVQVAEHWLGSVGSSRAFLFLHLNDLHRPYAPREPGADASYDDRIEDVDAAVGRLLQYLKTHQLYDQSTIIVVADHGEGLGEHGEQAHGGLLYDETLRVPLIIKPAAGAGAGSRVRTLVQHIDLVPTILDLVKAPVPGNLRGRSLARLLGGKAELGERLVYSESLFARYHFGWSELESLTDGRYRYIAALQEELYDLERDPHEHNNIAAAHQDVAESFRGALKKLAPTPPPPLALEDIDDETLSRYQAFGYVGIPSVPDPGFTERLDPKVHWDVVEQYRAAVDLSSRHEWDASIRQFQALTRREPRMFDVWRLLGATATRGERHGVAVDAYKAAIALAPDRLDTYLAVAAALLHTRKFDEAGRNARHVLAEATALPATTAAAHGLLARVALGRRDVALAHAEADLAEQADPALPIRAYVDGRIAFERRHFDDALRSFERVVEGTKTEGASSHTDARLYAAESLLRLERYSEAEYLFLEELAIPRLNTRARAGLTAVYTATGRTTEAAALGH